MSKSWVDELMKVRYSSKSFGKETKKKTVSEELMVKLGMWMRRCSMPNVAKPINNVKPGKQLMDFPMWKHS